MELAMACYRFATSKEEAATISGKIAPLGELFQVHARNLLGYLRVLLRREDLAEDALQEVFVRLAKRHQALGQIANLQGYLFRMARNEALRLVGREKRLREKHSALRPLPIIEPKPDAAEHAEEIAELEAALRKLPDEQREVVFLKCAEGFTFAKIGELLDVSQDTAASRYRYGIDKLRRLMESTK